MTWVNTTAARNVPLPIKEDVVTIFAPPHTPIFILVTATSIIAYDTSSLLPLDIHTRPKESLDVHGAFTQAESRNVAFTALDPAFSRAKSATLFIRTANNYTLIYSVSLNYQKSAYEVVQTSNGVTLQNSLPVAQGQAQNSLGAMLRLATKTLLHGATISANMTNIEHFQYQATDDEARNKQLPSVRLVLAKVIKVSSQIRRFWGKPNSHNLIFYNHLNQLQLLNYKTLRTESVALDKYSYFQEIKVLDYNMQENYFMCLNGCNDLSLFYVDAEKKGQREKSIVSGMAEASLGSEPSEESDPHKHTEEVPENVESDTIVSIKNEFLEHLNFLPEKIVFSPQSNIILFLSPSEESMEIRIHHLSALTPRLRLAQTLRPFPASKSILCGWAPCGSFFVCLDSDSGFWKVYSKFGTLMFDSDMAHSELFPGEGAKSHFCQASYVTVSPNSMALYVVSQNSLFKLDLLRLHESTYKLASFPLLFDDSYVSIPYSNQKQLMKVPILPSFQNILAHMHYPGSHTRKYSGFGAKVTVQLNSFDQLSMSYGSSLAISTPTCLGSVANHVLWYQFYNHSMNNMNIVYHFWLDDFLVLINRYEDGDIMDELVILNTCNSKFGNVGKEFKFDSDLILWRHTFKNQIINCNVSVSPKGGQTLVLLCDDFKLIVMEIEPKGMDLETDSEKRRLLRASKTIHLSSIKNRIALHHVKEMINIREKHFFFLLDTGDLYLLKNQSVSNDSGTQTRNMYELVVISHRVERVELGEIEFGTNEKRPILSLCLGDKLHIYKLQELLELTDTEGTGHQGMDRREREGMNGKPLEVGEDHVPGSLVGCRPVTIETPGFYPLRVIQESVQAEKTLEVVGLEYQTCTRSKHFLVRQRASRLLVLNEFIHRDLVKGESYEQIHANYETFKSYNYCLELLLFKAIDSSEQLDRVTGLIQKNGKKNHIFVSFLRKIEASHWRRFFSTLSMTPLEYMNELFLTKDEDLCYSYLNIYLNHKREYEDEEELQGDEMFGENEKSVVLHILRMLKTSRRWDQFLELCRFIKFLQPEGQIFEDIQLLANDRRI